MRGELTRLAALCLGLISVAGCVRTTSVEVRPWEGGREISLVRRWHGIGLTGCGVVFRTTPCDIRAGNYMNASMRLTGAGPFYAASQVEVRFLNMHGWQDLHRGFTEGGIQFDEARKTVTVGLGVYLRERVYPATINGTYGYSER